ncbi:hypothetical protein [Clostridium botulinum]|uniref:hypothetical protein n=1 Tax=Clostridium botulinum TaxID=1491 RepID=UPI00035BA708|nr:hypothetical protein [Clostridium botulinum]AUN06637.1 hypothetical protein RSJ14_07925 [Clostridium botulinum]EPS56457.1 hypothetical protein CLQ_02026 [Clostridium botulinum Af84]MBN3352726.1 hypothetical protein [Clostridium botulinum]MBN3358949.1 hypothetical protein [Clostridium botulinum]MBN3365634.1 hypothetical protein [Clostridium botulinum]
MEIGVLRAETKRYRSFKEKVMLVQKYENKYHVEDIGGWLSLIRRGERGTCTK